MDEVERNPAGSTCNKAQPRSQECTWLSGVARSRLLSSSRLAPFTKWLSFRRLRTCKGWQGLLHIDPIEFAFSLVCRRASVGQIPTASSNTHSRKRPLFARTTCGRPAVGRKNAAQQHPTAASMSTFILMLGGTRVSPNQDWKVVGTPVPEPIAPRACAMSSILTQYLSMRDYRLEILTRSRVTRSLLRGGGFDDCRRTARQPVKSCLSLACCEVTLQN